MIKIPLRSLLGFWLRFSSMLPRQGLESKNPAQTSVSTLGRWQMTSRKPALPHRLGLGINVCMQVMLPLCCTCCF